MEKSEQFLIATQTVDNKDLNVYQFAWGHNVNLYLLLQIWCLSCGVNPIALYRQNCIEISVIYKS